jgi:hypothetical protein
MSDWTKDDWENLIAGILGVALVILLLIGFIFLLGALFEAIPDCPDGAPADWCEGDPPDSNAI